MTGWGRYPAVEAETFDFDGESQARSLILTEGEQIVYGMGRSYGDSALNHRILLSRRHDRLLRWAPERRLLLCESGATLDDLLQIFVPRGWFPPVVPGTRYVTLGGAVAADVHGKNHHRAGSFCDWVRGLRLLLPSGETVWCTDSEHRELFRATCGGMGLTGVILEVELEMQRISSGRIEQQTIACRTLEEVFELFDAFRETTYSVAWLDTAAPGKQLGRSILILGEHAAEGSLDPPGPARLSVPFQVPEAVLNRYSASFFNKLYYNSRRGTRATTTTLASFFFPLDGILNWNRIYGSVGPLQYQFVLPVESSLRGLTQILQKIAASRQASFLTVLKLFGAGNQNSLSFPTEGYTLALDFRVTPSTLALLKELDTIVLQNGGRFYLAKDARIESDVFRHGYPGLDNFRRFRQDFGMKGVFDSLQSSRLEL